MSGRIRSIKPELLEDEMAAALPDDAWRLWVSLWVLADDHGNVRLGEKYIAANVWQDTTRAVTEPIRVLADRKFISPYAVRGQRYGHINGWERHQRVDNAGKPRVPVPSEDDGTWDQQVRSNFAETRGKPSETPKDTGGPGETPTGVTGRADLGEPPLARAPAHSGGETNDLRSPTTTTERDRARAQGSADGVRTPLPDDFTLTPERKAYAESIGVTDVDAVFRKFRNVAQESGKPSADWDASWRKFCDYELPIQRKARDRDRQRPGGAPTGGASTSPTHRPITPIRPPRKDVANA